MSRSGSLRATTSDYALVGRDSSALLCGTKSLGCGKPSRACCTQGGGHLLHSVFHGQQRTVHLFLTQPPSVAQGTDLGLNPFTSFLSATRGASAYPTALSGMLPAVVPHSSFLQYLHWVRALSCSCSCSLSPQLSQRPFSAMDACKHAMSCSGSGQPIA